MNCGDCNYYRAGTAPEDIRSKRGTCTAPYPGWANRLFDSGFQNVWAIDGHTFNHADNCGLFKLKLINKAG